MKILKILMFLLVSEESLGLKKSTTLISNSSNLQSGREKLELSSHKPQDAVWQPVHNTRNRFYVYSAFIERRKRSAVRVIAATRTAIVEDSVFCRVWLPDNRTYLLEAQVKPIRESHQQYYGAAFVLCWLNELKPDEVVTGAVAVVTSTSTNHITNLFKIVDTTPRNKSKTNIHICVRPLHNSYNNYNWMIEWIELNRILGAFHFYFYNTSIGDKIDCMFRKYKKREELFTLLPFQLPIHLWAEGQLAAMHDCLYRSISKADWLLIIDLDEVVVPHHKGIQLLEQNLKRNAKAFPALFDLIGVWKNSDAYAYIFRNSYFNLGSEDDPQSPAPLFTSWKTRRTKSILWYGIRSKYAVRPSKVVELGIHEVEEFESGAVAYNTFNVDPDIALLHHYRSECTERNCYEQYLSTMDRTAQKWAQQLWKRVKERLKDINRFCI